MRAWYSIRLLAPALATVLALGAIAIEYITLSTRLLEREAASARSTLQSTALLTQGVINRELRHTRAQDGLQQLLGELNFQPLIEEGLVLTPDDRVISASDRSRLGATLETLGLPGIATAARRVRDSSAGVILPGRGPHALIALYPVSFADASDASALRNATGLLLIRSDFSARRQAIEADILSATLRSAGGIVVTVLLLALGVHLVVTRRVTRLLGATERYLAGQTDSRAQLGGRDEIGEISAAFDRVADAAEAAKDEMRELNQTLESRVQRRTEALSREVEERRAAERESATRRAELRDILDTAADAVIAINEQGTVLEFNPAAERIFGWSAADIIGQNIERLMPATIAAEHQRHVASFKATGESRVMGQEREVQALRRDGTLFPLELTINGSEVHGERLLIGVGRDISARREAETALMETQTALLQAEKMAALGNLVAGVAHEVNTPIGIGVTAASHLREAAQTFEEKYRAGGMKRADLEAFLALCQQSTGILESNLFRASDLIRSFKRVAVDQSGEEIRELDLAFYVDEVLLSLRPKLKKRPITVSNEIPPDLLLTVQAGALSQILTNLIVNSLIHAFDEDQVGHIHIGATLEADDLLLDYRDDGKGMDAPTVQRIFDPFYTTKRNTGGSGLGMHITYNLVTQALQGSIQCQSTPGDGARFLIRLPITPEPGDDGAADSVGDAA